MDAAGLLCGLLAVELVQHLLGRVTVDLQCSAELAVVDLACGLDRAGKQEWVKTYILLFVQYLNR